MNFFETVKKVENSKEFSEFKKKYEKAYLCAAFFVIDFETQKNIQQLDYQLGKGRVAIFSLDGEIKMKIEKTIKKGKLGRLGKIKIEIDKIGNMAREEAKKKNAALKKIIAILYAREKPIWDCTAILDSFQILKLRIDASSGKILKSEKASMFDFARKI